MPEKRRANYIFSVFCLSILLLLGAGCVRHPAIIEKGTLPEKEARIAAEKQPEKQARITAEKQPEKQAAMVLPSPEPERKARTAPAETLQVIRESAERHEPAKTADLEVKKEEPPAEQPDREEPLKKKGPLAVQEERVTLPDINFDYDKYTLRIDARETLKLHTQWLLRHEEYSLIIEGHCDERGSHEYNLALGERRAQEAMKYLVALGLPAKNIRTVSYGKELPLDPRSNEEAWTRNRRASFIVRFKQ